VVIYAESVLSSVIGVLPPKLIIRVLEYSKNSSAQDRLTGQVPTELLISSNEIQQSKS